MQLPFKREIENKRGNTSEHPTVNSAEGGIIVAEVDCEYEKVGIEQSMSKKGCLPDNSDYEGLFSRFKNEMSYN